MAEAPGGAIPRRQPRDPSRRQGRLSGWWSRWLHRNVPLLEDPAVGRLDRMDGVTPLHTPAPAPSVAEQDTTADRPGRGAAS